MVSTSKRPVPLQHHLFHDDNMYCLMQAEGSFKTGAIAAAEQKQKVWNDWMDVLVHVCVYAGIIISAGA